MKQFQIFSKSKFSPDVWTKFIENANTSILPKLLTKTEADVLLEKLEILIKKENKDKNWNKKFFLYIEKNGTVYSCEGYTGCATCGHNFQSEHHIRVFNSIEDYNEFFNIINTEESPAISQKINIHNNKKYAIEEIRFIESEENYLTDEVFRETILLSLKLDNKIFEDVFCIDINSNIIPSTVYPGFEQHELNQFEQFNPQRLNQFRPEWNGNYINMINSMMFPFLYEKDEHQAYKMFN